MNDAYGRRNLPSNTGHSRLLSILLWLSVFVGWLVSIFSLIKEMCLATACSDAASFTIFGVNMGWFGITYFSLILLLLWLRNKDHRLDWALSAMVFAGIGSEFRLIWIQKYIIGNWCPLCVTICCSLFIAATLLVVDNIPLMKSGSKNLSWRIAFVLTMISTGLAIAIIGVRAV